MNQSSIIWHKKEAVIRLCPAQFLKWHLPERLTIWGTRTGTREIRWCHWNGNWKLSRGEWGPVGSIIIQVRPWIPRFRPFIEEGPQRVTFMLDWLGRTKLTSEEWVLLLLGLREWANGYLPDILHWVELRIVALQKRTSAIFRDWIWRDLRWHQTPCALKGRVHAKTPCTSTCFRKKTTFICFSFNSIRVPAIFG